MFTNSAGRNWLILRASAPGTTALETTDGALFTKAFLKVVETTGTNLSNINARVIKQMSSASSNRVQISNGQLNTLTPELLRWQFILDKPKLTRFKPGDKVIIVGLTTNVKLNGRRSVVTKAAAVNPNEIRIRFNNSNKTVDIKSQNLELCMGGVEERKSNEHYSSQNSSS